jgi:hypothetical protein
MSGYPGRHAQAHPAHPGASSCPLAPGLRPERLAVERLPTGSHRISLELGLDEVELARDGRSITRSLDALGRRHVIISGRPKSVNPLVCSRFLFPVSRGGLSSEAVSLARRAS